MRNKILTLVLPALAMLPLIAGCVGSAARPAPEEAVLACRAKADEHYRSRYVPQWQAYVDTCLSEQSGR